MDIKVQIPVDMPYGYLYVDLLALFLNRFEFTIASTQVGMYYNVLGSRDVSSPYTYRERGQAFVSRVYTDD